MNAIGKNETRLTSPWWSKYIIGTYELNSNLQFKQTAYLVLICYYVIIIITAYLIIFHNYLITFPN